jgi:hypothetical protein
MGAANCWSAMVVLQITSGREATNLAPMDTGFSFLSFVITPKLLWKQVGEMANY